MKRLIAFILALLLLCAAAAAEEGPEAQEPVTGYDPEESADDPPLKAVLWMALNEISEKDRAFLWFYGLMSVDGFFEKVRAWGDEISYPRPEDRN